MSELSGCWRGWYRGGPGGTWSQLASGNSFEDCRAALLDALGQHLRGQRGQTMILQAGVHPDRRATFGRRFL
jgi:hypothetical protein